MTMPAALDEPRFADIRKNDCLYIDQTGFLSAWWRQSDPVTVIARPRKFGKTLMLDAVRRFFSNGFTDQGALFSGLDVWKDSALREEAGRHHVLRLSWRHIAAGDMTQVRLMLTLGLCSLHDKYRGLIRDRCVEAELRERLASFNILNGLEHDELTIGALRDLCMAIHQSYGEKPVVLLDGYDEPLWKARDAGCLDEVEDYLRRFMTCTLKDNSALGRALFMGELPVSEESVFSGVSNVRFCTASAGDPYGTWFGFSPVKVLSGLDLRIDLGKAKYWYGGYHFGEEVGLCNPWSVINFVTKGSCARYWAKTSKNELAERLIRTGSCDVKERFLDLLADDVTEVTAPERLSLHDAEAASAWTLLVSTGYLTRSNEEIGEPRGLVIPNVEVKKELDSLIGRWFSKEAAFRAFMEAVFKRDAAAMGKMLTTLAAERFACFEAADGDWANGFYGLALALSAALRTRYVVRSTSEAGTGRFDLMLLPLKPKKDGFYVFEFKWKRPDETLKASAEEARRELNRRSYEKDFGDMCPDLNFVQLLGVAYDGGAVLVTA